MSSRDDKQWKPFCDECSTCGAEAEVFTSLDDGLAYEDDLARCCAKHPHTGVVSIDGEGGAWIAWDDAGEDEV